jgi:cycloeucalenol cycloisomerase
VLAADPSKRWTERFILFYTPVWIAAVVVVMATRAFTHWGDLGHMALGVGLVAPLYLVPLVSPPPTDRARPLAERHIWRFNLWIGLYSLLQTYFGSALFFDVLHMEYHFPVTWIWNRTPIFLYLMTITYFSTYYVVMSVLWRRVPRRPVAVRILVLVVLGYAVAFAETFGMANEWLRDYFSYKDKWFVLIWGSACYGSIFVLSLPFVFRLDEDPTAPRPSLSRLCGEVLAVNMAALCAYELWAVILARV